MVSGNGINFVVFQQIELLCSGLCNGIEVFVLLNEEQQCTAHDLSIPENIFMIALIETRTCLIRCIAVEMRIYCVLSRG